MDDADRARLLTVVAQGLGRFDAVMLSYCLMSNHYHFVMQTRQGKLSLLMRHINGVYSQAYNRRHGKVGHVFQGRFKAILVDEDAYLLEVCRYVELNPVRAGMVAEPGAWPWSSYRAHVGKAAGAPWLATAALHSYLLGQDAESPRDRARAQKVYAAHVAAGRGVALWEEALNRQIYLGDNDFVQRMLDAAEPGAAGSREVPKAQRPKTMKLNLAQWLALAPSREEALRRAHTEGGMTMTAIAAELGLTVARVSQLVSKAERALETDEGGEYLTFKT
ncbi:transposase [Paucibacter sp. DJ1R-11]|uniref:transposase n=1 Tax=Paucibacter sp. DJ1R-11 TaxID=2893556 RepID=UPI0021E456D8|nr:transposase [Paucibacter sp. DJ1R-11]